MKLIKRQRSNSQGMTIVVALLILSLASTTVLLVTGLIATQIRTSLNTVNAIGAYYAGESGIEQALYYIKYSKTNSDFSDNFDQLMNPPHNSFTLGEGQYNFITASTTVSRTWGIYNLSTSSPQHLDIIDPAGEVGTINWHNNVSNLGYQINWEIDNCFPEHASDRLETTLYSFGANYSDPQTRTIIDICNCAYGDNSCDYIFYPILNRNRYYRLSFRPLDNDVKFLSFYLNTNSAIKSQALIIANGVYRNSIYRVEAKLPALNPTSDIFSYVLFSEEDLTKGY